MLYIDVPYEEKDKAKALGAKWNPKAKSWYVENAEYYYNFLKWIPKYNGNTYIILDHIYVIEADRICYKCKRNTTVIAFGIDDYISINDFGRDCYKHHLDGIKIVEFFEPMPEFLVDCMKSNYGYCLGSTSFGDVYYANHCKHCDAIQGRTKLHSNTDSPFYIDSKLKASNLIVKKYCLAWDLVLSNISFSMVPSSSEELNIKLYAKIIDTHTTFAL